jgi:hypothetical protein
MWIYNFKLENNHVSAIVFLTEFCSLLPRVIFDMCLYVVFLTQNNLSWQNK